MFPNLKKEQLENIQIDYGIVFVNYGEADGFRLGPTRGGGTFTATKTLRDLEFDGSRGKEKGMQSIDDIDAVLAVTNLDTSLDNLAVALPYGDYNKTEKKITVSSKSIGIVKDEAYLKNVTMFCKTVKGEYKKITLFNAMTENDFSLAAVPKGEGTVAMEIHAHWDATQNDMDLFTIEDITEIAPVA